MALSPKEKLNQLFEAEVDRRFETEILDRLRGKRLSPLAQTKTETVDEKADDGMSDDEFSMLQALAQGDDSNAA